MSVSLKGWFTQTDLIFLFLCHDSSVHDLKLYNTCAHTIYKITSLLQTHLSRNDDLLEVHNLQLTVSFGIIVSKISVNCVLSVILSQLFLFLCPLSVLYLPTLCCGGGTVTDTSEPWEHKTQTIFVWLQTTGQAC